MTEFYPGMKPQPLEISRLFPVRAEALFRAWSSSAAVKRWFCPEPLTIPEAEVDFRVGGVFDICMRFPNGTDSWTRGRFTELVPYERLSFTGDIFSGEKKLFTATTSVNFTPEPGGTRMSVHQAYELFAPEALLAVNGAHPGWSSTLDRLGREADRLASAAVHGDFTLERVFTAPPTRVFHALTDATAKEKWFAGGHDQQILERTIDARPGGRECVEGRWPDGTVSRFDAVYFDVTQDTRLVYAYEMHINGEKISVSLATLELTPVAGGTKLVLTEQGSFLNGYQDNGARKEGTAFLLGRLGASLGENAPPTSPAQNCGGRS
jgi:uncharacterized protein YndB with AHSA1/START domain